jgi:hypothetical protein
MGPGRGMQAGLKILVSAVQSRPSPPFNFRTGTHLRGPKFQHPPFGDHDSDCTRTVHLRSLLTLALLSSAVTMGWTWGV